MTVGTKLIFTNPDTKEKFHGEIINLEDPRIRTDVEPNVLNKLVLPDDICILWETGQSSTYDPEFLDELCEEVQG